MTLTLLTTNYPPVLDGVGDYSAHLANELSAISGHKLDVICGTHNNNIFLGKSISLLPIIPVWNYRAIPALLSYIRANNPTWFLVQYVPNSYNKWAMPFWLPILLWIVKREGVQISIFFHEVHIRKVYWPIKYWTASISQRLICKLLLYVADISITSIDLYANWLKEKTNKPIYTVPIPSNIRPIKAIIDEIALLRRELIAPNNEYIICTFGLRNQDLLMQVFTEIRKFEPTTRLLICGRLKLSSEGERYHARLKSHIVVTGFMDAANVYRYLLAADAYFLPDFVDDRGRGGTCNKSAALAAGLAAGLPTVGTVGDMNNALLRKTPGLILESYGDVSAIAQSLLKHLRNPNKEKLRLEIQKFSDTYLHWGKIAETQLSLLSYTSDHHSVD